MTRTPEANLAGQLRSRSADRALDLPSFLARCSAGIPAKRLSVGLVLLFLALVSVLLYPAPYAPLMVPATIFVVAIVVTFVRMPIWALYAALFVVLLPVGILPAQLHSFLNRALTMVVLVVWLFAGRREGLSRIWSSTSLFMMGFLLWATVTLFWAKHTDSATLGLQVYAIRLVLFLILVPALIKTPRDLNGLMLTVALCGWTLVAVSTGFVLAEGYAPGTRLKVLGVNQNDLALTALLALPGILWQARRIPRPSLASRLEMRFYPSYRQGCPTWLRALVRLMPILRQSRTIRQT